MPSYYSVPLIGNLGNQNFQVEDVDKFQKLPFYLVMNEIRRYPAYKCWDSLFGSIKWQANMGSIMRGVRPEPSPEGNSFVFPANITSAPNRHIFETMESTEEARVKLQRFESRQFYFLPSWQDFRDNQLKYNHDDIIRQVAMFNEKFIQGCAYYRAPNVYICGNNGTQAQFGNNDLQTGVPTNDLPASDINGLSVIPVNGKTDGYHQAIAAATSAPLTLRHLYRAIQFFDEDIGALPFEGTLNTPRENELVKGKYVIILGTQAWRRWTFDDATHLLKAVNLDLLFDKFKGSLFGNVTTRPIRHPLRFNEAGVFVAPEIVEDVTNKTRPNPSYTALDGVDAAKWEVAFLVGADAWKTVTVGPPPSEFTSTSMDAEKFYKLRWNGEIQLTDQLLVRYADGSVDLNRYGTHLQLIGQMAVGALAGEVNNILPIYFRRSVISASEEDTV